MSTARSGHTATLLPDGKVLVAGGSDGSFLASAELYDPATGQWAATSAMGAARSVFTATLLPDGKVLVAGGLGVGILASAELYTPATGQWAPTGPMSAARLTHTATLLPDGKVLVAGGNGGVSGGGSLATAERYDPTTGAWTATGSMSTGRTAHTATLLPNGKVLAAGSYESSNITQASTELRPCQRPMDGHRRHDRRSLLPYRDPVAEWQCAARGGANDLSSLATAELHVP
ncbi:MAG: hypothetical protein EOP82_05785 [Variovorax sp.]|nr:MAG: hypothetical protein EOP82_05785 [Variovorax sp.]